MGPEINPADSHKPKTSFLWDTQKDNLPIQFVNYLRDLGYKDKNLLELLDLVAEILKEEGNPTQAQELLRKALELQPENKELIQKLNLIYFRKIYAEKFKDLINQGKLSVNILEKAIDLSLNSQKSIEYILISTFGIGKSDIGDSMSKYYNCQFIEFKQGMFPPLELLSKLRKNFLQSESWVPLKKVDDVIHIVIDDPHDTSRISKIKAIFKGASIVINVGIREDIVQIIEHFFQGNGFYFQDSTYGSELTEIALRYKELEQEDEKIEVATDIDESSNEIIKLVDQIIYTAYKQRASDIHIEVSPATKRVHVRYRIDGVLKEITQIPFNFGPPVLSRLKVMANLDISDKRLPQDGKILFKRKGLEQFELRLATIPTSDGLEDAVLRILAKAGVMKLTDMGLRPSLLKDLTHIISQPYGLILVVGPTGSGKTTTLHAILSELNKPGVKIWAAEDPIEITQIGIRQVEVKPKIGLDFARIMRAFLRADPDVIMIGEMRDLETASVAIEASLTGHLVLSTLHTNSAPETVTRLLDIGLNPVNFSDSLLGILAQRLIRKLCPLCKEPYTPTDEEYEEMEKILEGVELPDGVSSIKYASFYRAKGCQACNESGYKGRLGIFELLKGSIRLKRLIKKGADTEEIFMQARADGMVTLRQEGIIRVLQGITDLQEVKRVVVS